MAVEGTVRCSVRAGQGPVARWRACRTPSFRGPPPCSAPSSAATTPRSWSSTTGTSTSFPDGRAAPRAAARLGGPRRGHRGRRGSFAGFVMTMAPGSDYDSAHYRAHAEHFAPTLLPRPDRRRRPLPPPRPRRAGLRRDRGDRRAVRPARARGQPRAAQRALAALPRGPRLPPGLRLPQRRRQARPAPRPRAARPAPRPRLTHPARPRSAHGGTPLPAAAGRAAMGP